MSRPKNRRLKKSLWHVSARMTAVLAVREAFPEMSHEQIGAAVGLTRYQVRHYLLGTVKSAYSTPPRWQGKLFEAMRALAKGAPKTASSHFEELARMLYAEVQP